MPKENLHDMDDPDGLLVRRARRGDRDAFERLVERHQHRLYTLAARLTGSRADAEDAVQEALIRAWLNLPTFRGGALFSTWLYRICVNAAHDLRSKRRPEPSEAAVETPDPRNAFVDSRTPGSDRRTFPSGRSSSGTSGSGCRSSAGARGSRRTSFRERRLGSSR